jgi:hypothetical protein
MSLWTGFDAEARQQFAATGVKTGALIRGQIERTIKESALEVAELEAANDKLTTEMDPHSQTVIDLANQSIRAKQMGDNEEATRLHIEARTYRERHVDPLRNQVNANLRRQHAIEAEIRSKSLDALEVDEPAQFDLDTGRLRGGKESIQEGASAFSRLVGTGSVDGKQVKIARAKSTRASYVPGQDTVKLATRSNARTVVHELGHWLEDNDPRIKAEAFRFFAQRTQGEASKSLRSTTGLSYRSDEYTKTDQFLDAYMGKTYGQRATELISMGLEWMFAKPVEFATKDPEMFDWLYNLVSQPGA